MRTEVQVQATAFAVGRGSMQEPFPLRVAVAAAVVTTTVLSAAPVAAVHPALVLALEVVQASVTARAACRPVQTRQAVGRHSAARFVAVLAVTVTAMMVYSTGRVESSRLGR